MSSIISALYIATNPEVSSPECHEVLVKQGKYYEAIRAVLGYEFESEFSSLVGRAASISEEESFYRGFRACCQLFSELMASKYSS